MMTKDDFSNFSRDMGALRLNLQESTHSWTDDLPVCPLSGVGFSTNQKYRADGFRREEHIFEDRSFHFCYDENTYFYGIFDGHLGAKAADFAAQRMPAEILLGQLKGKETDKEVREVLLQAFLAVEKSFFESIDDLLAEKENLRLQLQGLRTIEAIQQCPATVQRLKTVTEEIQTGTTAVVALVVKKKLFIANVGDSRAVLCSEDINKKIIINQLSVDHTFENEDEILRLSHLGLNAEKIKQRHKTGLQNCTRCIGNYTVKGGYKEFDNFSESEEEPITAEPNIVGGTAIDEKCKFLLLMSDGLYRSLEEATGTTNVNGHLVNMVLEQFSEQSTLNGVAQAVVDKVVRMHHDAFTRHSGTQSQYQKRDDITLLVRNFNCSLPNAHLSTINSYQQCAEKIPDGNTLSDVNSIISSNNDTPQQAIDFQFLIEGSSLTSNSESAGQQVLFQTTNDMALDENGRIQPYVDFSEFYEAVEDAHEKGLVPEDWLKPSS